VSGPDELIGVLLVTGAGGMLGRDVVRVARARRHGVHGLSRAKLDICDAEAVAAALGRHQPEVVINCAAFTDVDGAEAAEDRAFAVNGTAPGLLAAACRDVGARLVHVSTDYVFDGRAERPYVESDPVGPQSAYGRTKLAGERAVLDADGGHAVVRSSWLFGAGGRNFPATMLRLAAPADDGGGGRAEVSVVTDQIGAPTFTGHLAAALVELAERLAAEGPHVDLADARGDSTRPGGAAEQTARAPSASGIHHIAGAGRCSWNEFAVEVFAQAGVACAVLPSTSAEQARPAPRPPWSVLGSERPDALVLPPWQDGLSAYLTEIGRRARPVGEHEPQGVAG
jgi:dTDP-4-dehydrorhamnose reductase